MDAKRLYHTVRLWLCPGSYGRGKYLRTHNVFKSVGTWCSYQSRTIPLYGNLIKIGDHVTIASNVGFFTHDGVHTALWGDKEYLAENFPDVKFGEGIGCIEIGDHVFVGANSVINYNVKIGDHVVISAGSVITSDIPSNSVVRGNPAKVVCTLTQLLAMKAAKNSYPVELDHKMGVYVSKELEDWLWDDFYKNRK